MRVQPRIWIGLLVFIGYCLVVLIVGALSGVPYPDLGHDGGTLFRGAGISLIVGAVYLVIVTSLLGWWRPALFDRAPSRHKWPIIAPALMALLAILNLVLTDWASYDLAFFGASLVLLLVGFTEELTTRGILLVALRSRLSEVWVWLLTSILFALMHLLNIALGAPFGGTVSQVGFAFLGGTLFYIARRVFGSLIPAMILHGLWDFSVFAVGYGSTSPLAGFTSVLYPVVGVLGLIFVAFVIRGADEKLTFAAREPGAASVQPA
jgi:membrane protease YdiL (CAAX protease family)